LANENTVSGSKKKYISIVGYYGADNTGDEAILSVMLEQIKKLFPDLEPFVFAVEPEKVEKEYNVKSISIYHFKSNLRSYLKILGDSSVLLIGGGGLLQDWYHQSIFRGTIQTFLRFQFLARVVNTPVMYYALGVGPLRTKYGRWLVKHFSRRAELITVRDKESLELLESIGVKNKQIIQTADPAWELKPAPESELEEIFVREGINIDSSTPIFGICLRQWYHASGGMWKNESERLQKYNAYCEILKSYLEYLQSNFDAKIIIIPFQLPADAEFGKLISDMVGKPNSIHLLKEPFTPSQLLALFHRLDFVFGIRLHSLIFAGIADVPSVALAYDPKVVNLMKAVGLSDYMIPIGKASVSELAEKTSKALSETDSIKHNLAETIKQFTDMENRNGSLLKELVYK